MHTSARMGRSEALGAHQHRHASSRATGAAPDRRQPRSPQLQQQEQQCRRRRQDRRCRCEALPQLRPERPASDLRRYRTRYRWPAPLRADRRHSGPGDAHLITDRRWAPGRGSRHASVATDVEPALSRPHNPQWSRLPDGQLPLRQEQHKHGTAAGLLLVRTTRSADRLASATRRGGASAGGSGFRWPRRLDQAANQSALQRREPCLLSSCWTPPAARARRQRCPVITSAGSPE
jgi:hypothetical protein